MSSSGEMGKRSCQCFSASALLFPVLCPFLLFGMSPDCRDSHRLLFCVNNLVVASSGLFWELKGDCLSTSCYERDGLLGGRRWSSYQGCRRSKVVHPIDDLIDDVLCERVETGISQGVCEVVVALFGACKKWLRLGVCCYRALNSILNVFGTIFLVKVVSAWGGFMFQRRWPILTGANRLV